jgi:septal ring-binding cell division protein DamX
MKNAFEAAGDVRSVDLLAAFVSIWREKTSGSLRFTRGGASAGYDLADGDIVAVFSSEPRFETSAILVRAGKLDASALERLSIPPGTDAALAALQTGILTRREWKWGEKIRAIEILADLLTWADGKYLSDVDARPERGEFVLPIPRLVLELFLRSRDRNLVEHQLGPTDVPLRRSDNFDEEFSTFGLTADAESVVQLIDGGATAIEISERAPAEEFAVLKLLAALTTLGLLAPESSALSKETEHRLLDAEIGPTPDPPPFESWAPHAAPPPPADEPVSPGPLAEMPLEEGKPEPPRLDAEREWEANLGEPGAETVASPESPEPSLPDWEGRTPLDQPLVSEPEPMPQAPARRRSWGLIAAILFVLLLAAVAATVLLRSRFSRQASLPPVTSPPTAVPVSPSPVPTVPAAPSPLPTTIGARPAAAAAQAARPRATAVATARPVVTAARPPVIAAATVRPAAAATPAARPRATAVATARPPAPATPAPRGEVAGTERSSWLERARRDRRRMLADKKTRYAIQLELVCETPSLVEAWKHDRPTGTLWLLAETHQGRECFKVLWGRYGSIDEAKRAKSGVPAYFVTSSNRPAVVGVR